MQEADKSYLVLSRMTGSHWGPSEVGQQTPKSTEGSMGHFWGAQSCKASGSQASEIAWKAEKAREQHQKYQF